MCSDVHFLVDAIYVLYVLYVKYMCSDVHFLVDAMYCTYVLYVNACVQMCIDASRKEWFVWCRWGRVGETGATAELGPFKAEDDASNAFAKKFRDKTGNKWAVRMSVFFGGGT